MLSRLANYPKQKEKETENSRKRQLDASKRPDKPKWRTLRFGFVLIYCTFETIQKEANKI